MCYFLTGSFRYCYTARRIIFNYLLQYHVKTKSLQSVYILFVHTRCTDMATCCNAERCYTNAVHATARVCPSMCLSVRLSVSLKPRPILVTMSKQHCRMLQVKRFFRQCRMLHRHCCRFWQQFCRFRQQCRTKFRPFDNVETN